MHIAEPRFEAGGGATVPAITAASSKLFVGGTAAGWIQGGSDPAGGAAPAIHATGGGVLVDPKVQLNPFAPAPQPITGTAVAAIAPVPVSLVANDAPGQTLTATFTAPAGSVVVGCLGLPAAPLPTPIGGQFLQSSPLATLTVAVVPAAGVVVATTAVPAALPRGLAFAVQAVVLGGGGGLGFGLPGHFVVH